MQVTTDSAIQALIDEGERVLASYAQPGNIDRHDLWFESSRSFLAVNVSELERTLCSVAPKYREQLLLEPRGRAAYRLIQEQLQVLKLAQRQLQQRKPNTIGAVAEAAPDWKQLLDKSIEVKPGFFGLSLNLKELVKGLFKAKWK